MKPHTVEETIFRVVRRLRMFDSCLMALSEEKADGLGDEELVGLAEALRDMAEELDAIVMNAPGGEFNAFLSWTPAQAAKDEGAEMEGVE